jgi:hypothetical protein
MALSEPERIHNAQPHIETIARSRQAVKAACSVTSIAAICAKYPVIAELHKLSQDVAEQLQQGNISDELRLTLAGALKKFAK